MAWIYYNLFTHSSMDDWVMSGFWLLQIKLLEPFMYKFWIEIRFHFSGINDSEKIIWVTWYTDIDIFKSRPAFKTGYTISHSH